MTLFYIFDCVTTALLHAREQAKGDGKAGSARENCPS